mgnify:CR=1 FL=1
MIEPFLKDVNMVVLDNIATLCRTGKENESQSWQTMQRGCWNYAAEG